MHKVAIIHFAPLELYPPAQNLIRYVNKVEDQINLSVFTTSNSIRLSNFDVDASQINIFRMGKSGQNLPTYTRYLTYLIFNLGVLIQLLRIAPQCILYFETLSAWPAYVYKKWINKRCKILIHYHEYTTPVEYKNGMLLNRYFHSLEKKLLEDAKWISHTNSFRMDLFMKDILPVKPQATFILPNYPPSNWKSIPSKRNGTLKIVYIGALSMTTMYTQRFAEWVMRQSEMEWHIYSNNCTRDAIDFLKSIKCERIKIMPGVLYDELPILLKKYHVGVILYTGHIPNYIYNAPNKLFEYMACGLDVWFPREMVGCWEYICENKMPKVLPVSFQELAQFDGFQTAQQQTEEVNDCNFFCEDVLPALVQKLIYPC